MLNRLEIIGNLGNDPDMRYMTNGDAVCNLSVATSERWKDKATGEQKEKTEWHRVSVFGKLAEICGQYLSKGSKVYLSGPIATRKWQDKDGNDRYTTEMKARDMIMLDPKPQGGQQRQDNSQPNTGNDAPVDDDFDDDIPF